MNTDTQSHTSEHHRRHWDFAKLLTTLSVAFLTIVTASGGLATDNSWLLKSVLVGQLFSLFCGVALLYQMMREPAIHQQAVENKIDEKEATRQLEDNRLWCLWLHSAQILLFATSFLVLVFVLVFAEGSSDTHPKETVVDCRFGQEK